VILAAWVFRFFVPNMIKKDRSMARHAGFAEYKKATGLLFPRLWGRSSVPPLDSGPHG
jgi:hypothetical protein